MKNKNCYVLNELNPKVSNIWGTLHKIHNSFLIYMENYFSVSIGPIFVTVPAPKVKTKSLSFTLDFIYFTTSSKSGIYNASLPKLWIFCAKSFEEIPTVFCSRAA